MAVSVPAVTLRPCCDSPCLLWLFVYLVIVSGHFIDAGKVATKAQRSESQVSDRQTDKQADSSAAQRKEKKKSKQKQKQTFNGEQ